MPMTVEFLVKVRIRFIAVRLSRNMWRRPLPEDLLTQILGVISFVADNVLSGGLFDEPWSRCNIVSISSCYVEYLRVAMRVCQHMNLCRIAAPGSTYCLLFRCFDPTAGMLMYFDVSAIYKIPLVVHFATDQPEQRLPDSQL